MKYKASEALPSVANSHCNIWCSNRASIHLLQVGVMTSESGGDEDDDEDDADT